MADIHLTQAEADALIAMEKHRLDDERYYYPTAGSLVVPLQSPDKREQFLLDIRRGRIDLAKGKYQARARQVVVLVRLDLAARRTVTRTIRKSAALICMCTVRVMVTSGPSPYLPSISRGRPICGARWKTSCGSAASRCRLTLSEGYSHDSGCPETA